MVLIKIISQNIKKIVVIAKTIILHRTYKEMKTLVFCVLHEWKLCLCVVSLLYIYEDVSIFNKPSSKTKL